MNLLPVMACLAGFLPDSAAADARLREVRWSARRDTLRMEFQFEGARPRRLKFTSLQATTGRPGLRLDFEGVRWRKLSQSLPGWVQRAPTADSTGMVVRIDLRSQASWRMAWKGDVLALEMAAGSRPALWADPRVLGVAGVGLAAGAAAIWFYAQEESRPAPTPNTDDGIIPPPDFGFPR